MAVASAGHRPGWRFCKKRPAAAKIKSVRRRQPPAVGTGRRDIGQLADVAAGLGGDDGQMEIRIILDRAEPPAGRLRAVPDPGHCHAGQGEEIRFTGWLGLLRALYEVTGGPGAGSVRVP
jgi:hypothetical protein